VPTFSGAGHLLTLPGTFDEKAVTTLFHMQRMQACSLQAMSDLTQWGPGLPRLLSADQLLPSRGAIPFLGSK
jgi:hypothetical protein